MKILIMNTVGFKFIDENIEELRRDFPQHEFIIVDDKDVTEDQIQEAEIMVGFQKHRVQIQKMIDGVLIKMPQIRGHRYGL